MPPLVRRPRVPKEETLGRIYRDERTGWYIADYARTQMRAWKRYETSLGSLKPFFGNQFMTAIDAESIERYKHASVGKVEPSTVNRDLQCLRRMFNLAIVWRYASENPMKFVKFF